MDQEFGLFGDRSDEILKMTCLESSITTQMTTCIIKDSREAKNTGKSPA